MRGRGIIVEKLLFDSHEIIVIIAVRIFLWANIRRNPFRILQHHVVIVILAAIDVVIVIIVGHRSAGPLRSINRMERTKEVVTDQHLVIRIGRGIIRRQRISFPLLRRRHPKVRHQIF